MWPEKTREEILAESGGRVARERAAGAGAEKAAAERRERILIVDDEPAVRAIVGRILTDAGYHVDQAGDGAEALARYRDDGPYSLVLLDEAMPGMTGRRVLERLVAIDPAPKVVLFTGNEPEAGALPGVAGVLEKPVPMDTLIQYLRGVLRGP